jgi:hypothetical protein
MSTLFAPPQTTLLERRILRLGQRQRCIMFLALAEQLPGYPWRLLFATLGRLQELRTVELLTHQEGYEIRFLNPDQLPVTQRNLQASEHGVGHEETQC